MSAIREVKEMFKNNRMSMNVDWEGRDVIDVVPVELAEKAVKMVIAEQTVVLTPEKYIMGMIDKYHRPNVADWERFSGIMSLQDFMRLLALTETYFNVNVSCFAALKTYKNGSILNLIELVNLILEERKHGR